MTTTTPAEAEIDRQNDLVHEIKRQIYFSRQRGVSVFADDAAYKDILSTIHRRYEQLGVPYPEIPTLSILRCPVILDSSVCGFKIGKHDNTETT